MAKTRRRTITTAEASTLTGKSERTIQLLCQTGELDAIKEGNSWIIYKKAVNEYIRHEQTRIKANKYAYRRGERKW